MRKPYETEWIDLGPEDYLAEGEVDALPDGTIISSNGVYVKPLGKEFRAAFPLQPGCHIRAAVTPNGMLKFRYVKRTPSAFICSALGWSSLAGFAALAAGLALMAAYSALSGGLSPPWAQGKLAEPVFILLIAMWLNGASYFLWGQKGFTARVIILFNIVFDAVAVCNVLSAAAGGGLMQTVRMGIGDLAWKIGDFIAWIRIILFHAY